MIIFKMKKPEKDKTNKIFTLKFTPLFFLFLFFQIHVDDKKFTSKYRLEFSSKYTLSRFVSNQTECQMFKEQRIAEEQRIASTENKTLLCSHLVWIPYQMRF